MTISPNELVSIFTGFDILYSFVTSYGLQVAGCGKAGIDLAVCAFRFF